MGYGIERCKVCIQQKFFLAWERGGISVGKPASLFFGANPACIQPPPAREKRRRRVVMDALPPLPPCAEGEGEIFIIRPSWHSSQSLCGGKRAMRGVRGRKDGPEEVIVYCTKMRRCFEKARKGFLFARREMTSEFKWRTSPPSFTVCLHSQ